MFTEAWGVVALVVEGVFFFVLQESVVFENRLPDMRTFAKFFKDAGYYGGGSVVLAIILFAIAIWEHASGKNIATWWLELIAVLVFCYGCLVAWYKEYKGGLEKDAIIEAAKSPLPLIIGILSNFRFGGVISTGHIERKWRISGALNFDVYLCNQKPRETNLQKIELDGSALTPPLEFGPPLLIGVRDGKDINAVGGTVLSDGKGVTLTNLLISVGVYDFQHKSEIPPIDLKKLKAFAVDAFLKKHPLEIKDGETLSFW